MELHKALSQISQIRRQMARTAVFRGYRSATAAFSAVVAIVGGFAQSVLVPEPHRYMKGFLIIWLIAALLSVAAAATEMILRCVKSHSPLQKELTIQAAEQFVPCLVAGILLTLVLDWFKRDLMWLLPGLWAILFSLGIFASRRVLPGAVSIVAGYYLLAGLVCIRLTDPITAVSPSPMVLIFAPGQFLAAFVLWWTLEKDHGKLKKTDSQSEDSQAANVPENGRFAYDGLERVIHEKARLSIMSSLAAHPEGLLFNDLKGLCALTDGNLSRHMQLLQESKLVEVWKGFKNNRPQTLVRLTADGMKRFLEYVQELEHVVADALAAAGRAVPARLPLSKGFSPA